MTTQMSNIVTSRRLGSFEITRDLIETGDTTVMRVMGKCIVVRAEYMFHTNSIEYIAYSEWFRSLSEGEVVPKYEVFNDDGYIYAKEVK